MKTVKINPIEYYAWCKAYQHAHTYRIAKGFVFVTITIELLDSLPY